MDAIENVLMVIAENKYLKKLRYKPYSKRIERAEFFEIIKLILNIRKFMHSKFKVFNSKFYTPQKIDMEMFYSKPRNKFEQEYDHMVVVSVFRIEWNLWNTDQEPWPACDELTKLHGLIFRAISQRFKMIPGMPIGNYVDHNIVFLRGGELLLSMGAEGDKCEDMSFNVNIFGPNLFEYENENLTRFRIY